MSDAQTERNYRIALGSVLGLAAAFRLWHLGSVTLWIDEIFQSSLVYAPFRTFWAALRHDAAHPPLDYLVGRLVQAFHPTDPVRKVPDVLWGVGSIAALAELVRRRGGRRLALLTAAFLAAAPFHVRYSQEYRPYALGTLLAAVTLGLVDRVLDRPTAGRSAASLLAALATAYTLYVAAIAVAVGAAALVATDAFSSETTRRANAREVRRSAPAALAVLALLYLPWLSVVRTAAARTTFHAERVFDPKRWRLLLAFFTVSPSPEGWSFGPKPLYAAAFLLALLLLAAGTVACSRRPALRFLPLCAFGGIASIEALRTVSPHFAPFRCALPSAIALAGVAASGVEALFSRGRRILAIAVLSAVLLFQGRALESYYRSGRYDWSRLLAVLRASPSSEPIYTSAHNPQYCIAYYLCGPAWLTDGHRCGRPLVNLEGGVTALDEAKSRGESAWLVLDGAPASAAPRAWAASLPELSFPEAEGCVLKRIGGGSSR